MSSDIHYSVPVLDTLSRNKYFQILGILHVIDNELIAKENAGRLDKIRPLTDKQYKKFQLFRMADQVQNIDDSMKLFKSRSTLKKQYNPLKPI